MQLMKKSWDSFDQSKKVKDMVTFGFSQSKKKYELSFENGTNF